MEKGKLKSVYKFVIPKIYIWIYSAGFSQADGNHYWMH